ncbi:CDA peptide synthetase III domain protein [Burkholderia pseudomallei]|nr:CDA peptide synthetase III domain protein [Burkholderia pseudomallei]
MRIASSELPPRLKKLSSTPNASFPSSSRQSASSAVSVGDSAGAATTASLAASSSARRSTFWFVVSGNASITTTWAGTMCAGSRARR